MNKSDFVSRVSTKSGMSKEHTKTMIDAFIDTLIEELKSGESVQIMGFGTFNVNNKAERMGNHPNGSGKVKIAASRSVSFKSGSKLKTAMRSGVKK